HPPVSLEQRPDARQGRPLQAEEFGQFPDRRRALERQSGEDGKLGRAEAVRTQLLLEQSGDHPGALARSQTVAPPAGGEVDARAHANECIYTRRSCVKGGRRTRGDAVEDRNRITGAAPSMVGSWCGLPLAPDLDDVDADLEPPPVGSLDFPLPIEST